MEDYKAMRSFWNDLFKKIPPSKYEKLDLGQEDLNKASTWLTSGTKSILDYGCGSGTFLFDCALKGTKYNIGVDISAEAIKLAKERAKFLKTKEFEFIEGGLEYLNKIKNNSIDGVILSNIVDNLIPKDGESVLFNIHRIVHAGGKILVKVNQFLTKEQIKEYKFKDLGNDLFLDTEGLYIWNLDTEKWCKLLNKYFDIYIKKDIYYEEYGQYNRLFLLINKE